MFGPQRFGSANHLVGKCLVKNDYKKAVKVFLNKAAKGKWERFVSNYLEKHPNDFVNAFRPVPYRLKKIFINSYQSYIWNKTANIIKKLVKRDIRNISIPITGSDTKISSNLIGKTIKGIMKTEKINFADFEIKDLSIKSNGSERKLFARPDQFKIIEITEDELNMEKKKAVISFILPPGSYAAVFLKALNVNV